MAPDQFSALVNQFSEVKETLKKQNEVQTQHGLKLQKIDDRGAHTESRVEEMAGKVNLIDSTIRGAPGSQEGGVLADVRTLKDWKTSCEISKQIKAETWRQRITNRVSFWTAFISAFIGAVALVGVQALWNHFNSHP